MQSYPCFICDPSGNAKHTPEEFQRIHMDDPSWPLAECSMCRKKDKWGSAGWIGPIFDSERDDSERYYCHSCKVLLNPDHQYTLLQ